MKTFMLPITKHGEKRTDSERSPNSEYLFSKKRTNFKNTNRESQMKSNYRYLYIGGIAFTFIAKHYLSIFN